MGKVSPKNGKTKASKQKRRPRNSSNKYLRPGALAQIQCNKSLATKPCTDLGKKMVALIDADKENKIDVIENNYIEESPKLVSPIRFDFHSDRAYSPTISSPARSKIGSLFGPIDFLKNNNLQMTPRTPLSEDYGCESESRIESLPSDLLIKIMCHLEHDQLRPVFHVSQKIRQAVIQARQFYFNYTTPDRTRQEMLRIMTPRPTDRWPFISREDVKGLPLPRPHTPKAPRHGPRAPSRLKFTEMRQIACVLLKENTFPSRCLVPKVLAKPVCKPLASNRALFYEEELSQAVAQNKLH